jgi:hypothetical protein
VLRLFWCPYLPEQCTDLIYHHRQQQINLCAVLPVVSDFDCFLLGTRGIRYQTPLPEEQVNLVHEVIDDTEKILQDCSEGKSTSWTASWLANMKQKTGYRTMPKYGFGDPKSYQIMRHAVKRLEEFGAVRHGAEVSTVYSWYH